LEAEVFLAIGAWKNFEDLEESLTLPELDLLLQTIRNDKKETNVFLAAIQGIDLNKHYSNPVKDKIKEIEERAAIRAAGGQDEYDRHEFAEFGIEFEDE
jgi:hypothetical protein